MSEYVIRSESGTGQTQYVKSAIFYTSSVSAAKKFDTYRQALDFQKEFGTGGYVIKL